MITTSKRWDAVTAAFDQVEEHVRKQFARVGRDATVQRTHLEKSVRGVVTLMEEFFDAAATTVRDPVLRKDLLHLAETMRAALLSTIEHAGGDLPRTTARRRLADHTATHPAHPAKRTGRSAARAATSAKAARTTTRSAGAR